MVDMADDSSRVLTRAQEGRLEGVARDDPDARVISWSHHYEGPVIRAQNGDWYTILPRGRKQPISNGELSA